jgi:hypothetical protein
MPIRRAEVSRASLPIASQRALMAWIMVGVALAVALTLGDHFGKPRARSGDPTVIGPPIVEIAPVELEFGLAATKLLGPVALEHELHLAQRRGAELLLTGLVFGDPERTLDRVQVEVRSRDGAGPGASAWEAQLGCRSIAPGEACPWMLAAELPGRVDELEILATATPSLRLWASVDRRSERGELDFDPERGLLGLRIEGGMVLSAWASVTAYAASGRVLGVAQTYWPGLAAGEHELEVAVPRAGAEVDHFAVRFGADQPEPLLEPAPGLSPEL